MCISCGIVAQQIVEQADAALTDIDAPLSPALRHRLRAISALGQVLDRITLAADAGALDILDHRDTVQQLIFDLRT